MSDDPEHVAEKFDYKRALLYANQEDAVQMAEQKARNAEAGHTDLFGEISLTAEGSENSYNHFDSLSFAPMMVSTNDAFDGLNSMELPKETSSAMVPAYDAGSALNDEDCANIPGPPCGDTDDSGEAGEGYVYIGNGISGNGDVDSLVYDWNNPVARVVVHRVR